MLARVEVPPALLVEVPRGLVDVEVPLGCGCGRLDLRLGFVAGVGIVVRVGLARARLVVQRRRRAPRGADRYDVEVRPRTVEAGLDVASTYVPVTVDTTHTGPVPGVQEPPGGPSRGADDRAHVCHWTPTPG
jgi:hypothetical protein